MTIFSAFLEKPKQTAKITILSIVLGLTASGSGFIFVNNQNIEKFAGSTSSSSTNSIKQVQRMTPALSPRCNSPLPYKVGNVDSGFSISLDEAKGLAKEAEDAWEAATGRDLFIQSDNASLVIYFDYSALAEGYKQHQKLAEALNEEQLKYQKLKTDYQIASKTYSNSLAVLKRIQLKGGVQPVVAIRGGQSSTSAATANAVYQQTMKLYTAAKNIQSELSRSQAKINQIIALQNEVIKNSTDSKSELGVYKISGNKEWITVFAYYDIPQLKNVLIHEMGHSLGLEHETTQNSIMYTQVGSQQNITQVDLNQLKTICNF